MLSYQHAYHAGNLADVHKHALLAHMLAYLTAKPKPLSYLETHAGRGLYSLSGPEAQKTGEAAAGIELADRRGWFGVDHPYRTALDHVRAQEGADAYPGSPVIAGLALRPEDRAVVAELHPQEFAALSAALLPYPISARQTDGLAMARALTPPDPRRGLMLIDPSYEVKAEYETVPKAVADIHRKWNVGVIVLWYPILTDRRHLPMLALLEALKAPKSLRHEVTFPPAKEGHGMCGSGLFILNPPYGTEEEARRLSRLYATL
ncbi:MAG: 23S rRNA (adenine(2030)-N(6))-methyltransferase RlmJ [Paracoccaceae bacterium]